MEESTGKIKIHAFGSVKKARTNIQEPIQPAKAEDTTWQVYQSKSAQKQLKLEQSRIQAEKNRQSEIIRRQAEEFIKRQQFRQEKQKQQQALKLQQQAEEEAKRARLTEARREKSRLNLERQRQKALQPKESTKPVYVNKTQPKRTMQTPQIKFVSSLNTNKIITTGSEFAVCDVENKQIPLLIEKNIVEFFLSLEILQEIVVYAVVGETVKIKEQMLALYLFLEKFTFVNRATLRTMQAFMYATKFNEWHSRWFLNKSRGLDRFDIIHSCWFGSLPRVSPNKIVKMIKNPLLKESSTSLIGFVQHNGYDKIAFYYSSFHGYNHFVEKIIADCSTEDIEIGLKLAIYENQSIIVAMLMTAIDPTHNNYGFFRLAMANSSIEIIRLILHHPSHNEFRKNLDVATIHMPLLMVLERLLVQKEKLDNIYELIKINGINSDIFTEWDDSYDRTYKKEFVENLCRNSISWGHMPIVKLFVNSIGQIDEKLIKQNKILECLNTAAYNAKWEIFDLFFDLDTNHTPEFLLECMLHALNKYERIAGTRIEKALKIFKLNPAWNFNLLTETQMYVLCRHAETMEFLLNENTKVDFSVNNFGILKFAFARCHVDIVAKLLKSTNPLINYFLNTHSAFMLVVNGHETEGDRSQYFFRDTGDEFDQIPMENRIAVLKMLLNDPRQNPAADNNRVLRFLCHSDKYIEIFKLFIDCGKIFLGTYFKFLLSTVHFSTPTVLQLLMENEFVRKENNLEEMVTVSGNGNYIYEWNISLMKSVLASN